MHNSIAQICRDNLPGFRLTHDKNVRQTGMIRPILYLKSELMNGLFMR